MSENLNEEKIGESVETNKTPMTKMKKFIWGICLLLLVIAE